MLLGTLAARGFSRLEATLADDPMFFIPSKRMMPPIAVAAPIYMMCRYLSFYDSRIGNSARMRRDRAEARRVGSDAGHGKPRR